MVKPYRRVWATGRHFNHSNYNNKVNYNAIYIIIAAAAVMSAASTQ